jgi:hypothetical protein
MSAIRASVAQEFSWEIVRLLPRKFSHIVIEYLYENSQYADVNTRKKIQNIQEEVFVCFADHIINDFRPNVLFLDIDNVLFDIENENIIKCVEESVAKLNSSSSSKKENEEEEDLNAICEKYLDKDSVDSLMRTIQSIPKVMIVLSSSWRLKRGAIGLQNLFSRFGEYILGKTPLIDDGKRRYREILVWLEAHQINNFAIIDDIDYFFSIDPLLRDHFVHVEDLYGNEAEELRVKNIFDSILHKS